MSVEAVIIFPLLMWAYAAMFVYWDAFKSQNINLKATYTIADLISRYECPIMNADIEGMNSVYSYLIRSDNGNDIRVSVVSMGVADDGVTPELDLEWSYATGVMTKYDNLDNVQGKLPIMATGDQLILVDSTMNWEPPLTFALIDLGLGNMTFGNSVFTAPRFIPQVLHEEPCS